MTDREFVRQQYPDAYLESVTKPKMRLKETQYKVRENRHLGTVIAIGSTRHIAWNNAKAAVKRIVSKIDH